MDVSIVQSPLPPPSPLLVYDGECRFCRRWVARLRRWAGQEIPSIASQDLEPGAHGISCSDAERALQYMDATGVRHSAAAAVVECLAAHGAIHWPRWIYHHVPGAAVLLEWGYAQVARRRQALSRLESILAGPSDEPATYDTGMGLMVRGTALVFAIAFASLGMQAEGLWGSRGVWPAEAFLAQLKSQGLGWVEMPSFFWLDEGDGMLQAAWITGLSASLLALTGRLTGPMLLAAWTLYLSFCVIGGPFLNFQWDALLLECGVVAMLAARWEWRPGGLPLRHAAVVRWLAWAVLFKLMWFSGVVKLSSGDVSWWGLTALGSHFETQPLPNPVAWAMHRLPDWIQAGITVGMFFTELVLPLAIFLPRRARLVAAVGFAALQLGILATGNYGFFNLLALVLCLPLLDDTTLRCVRVPGAGVAAGRVSGFRSTMAVGWATVFLLFLTVQAPGAFRIPASLPAPLAAVLEQVSALRSVNSYGLFAIMTTTRPEITLQGSNDGTTWSDYVFRYKPGPLDRPPPVLIGHMPRLDWQMWFAALGDARRNPWLVMLVQRLLEGSSPVRALLQEDPFPDRPPRFIRAIIHDYRFTQPGNDGWWTRRERGLYLPPLSLENFQRTPE